MINEKLLEKIKLYISVNEFLTDRRLPTDAEIDNYLIDAYGKECSIEIAEDDFVTYKILDDHIFIKDIVAFGNGYKLINKIIEKAKELNLPIRALVHFSNLEVLNVVIKRFRFYLVQMVGNQYLIERSN